jgi:hypothetical protein
MLCNRAQLELCRTNALNERGFSPCWLSFLPDSEAVGKLFG